MEKPEKRKRLTNKHQQFEIYLEYIKRYSVLKLNWVSQKGYTTELNNIWLDMTIKLNDCGGPVRDVTHWKKVFTEWKSHTRRKLKYNKPLNKIERELIDLTGLTSMPERKQKSEKLLKDKTSPEYNPLKVNKENERNDVIIKEEILNDWSDTSSTCFIEDEVIDGDSDEVHSKIKQKKSSQEKQILNEKQIVVEENQGQKDKQLKKAIWKDGGNKMSNTSKKKSYIKTADASVQVQQQMPNDQTTDGLANLSNSLLRLSNAINRYCDIVERRIF